MRIEYLDHVALWVADRDVLADFLTRHVGMHVIERTDSFTIVGAHARRGKLTLFAAEGERDPGPLGRVALRVRDLSEALKNLPPDLAVTRPAAKLAVFTGPEGLELGLSEATSDPKVDLVVAGAGMASLAAAAEATAHGASVLVLEKGDRAGGSMLLSSGVIWRYREWERFRAECPGADEDLQRAVYER